MIATDNPRKLLEKLEVAKKQLNNAKTREERMAISNYVYLLDDSIANVTLDYEPSEKTAFLPDEYNEELNRKYDDHNDRMLRNFIENKEFHRAFLEKIYKRVIRERAKMKKDVYTGVTELTEDEFYNIFYDFMNKIGLAKCFEKFVKNKRIYTMARGISNQVLGYTLYNPITKDTDIFMNDLSYNVFSMTTLAHEFGHVYDFNKFNGNISDWNAYFYQSFYMEIIPRVFERLFIEYLVENKFYVPEAKISLYDMHKWNYEFILTSYLDTLIPDEYISDGSYQLLSSNRIYRLVEGNFKRKNEIREFIDECTSIEIRDNFQYAYADIVAMRLKEKIKKNDFDLGVLDEFVKTRGASFDPQIISKLKITPNQYVKLYKKDVELLRK